MNDHKLHIEMVFPLYAFVCDPSTTASPQNISHSTCTDMVCRPDAVVVKVVHDAVVVVSAYHYTCLRIVVWWLCVAL